MTDARIWADAADARGMAPVSIRRRTPLSVWKRKLGRSDNQAGRSWNAKVPPCSRAASSGLLKTSHHRRLRRGERPFNTITIRLPNSLTLPPARIIGQNHIPSLQAEMAVSKGLSS